MKSSICNIEAMQRGQGLPMFFAVDDDHIYHCDVLDMRISVSDPSRGVRRCDFEATVGVAEFADLDLRQFLVSLLEKVGETARCKDDEEMSDLVESLKTAVEL